MSVFIGCLFLIVGCLDVVRHRTPNWACYGLLGLGLMGKAILSGGGASLAGAAVAGGIFFLVWLGNGVGGGDVKLMAAAGAWVGWPGVVDLLVYVGVLGAVWALGFWIWGRVRQGKGWRGRVPYGLPIGLGTALVLWGG